MTEHSSPPAPPDFVEEEIDLSLFRQYLRISSVLTCFFLPDELILDKLSKYVPHFLNGYNPRDAICHIVWHLACSLYNRASSDKTFFLAGHKNLDISNNRNKVIDLIHSESNIFASYIQCVNREQRKYRTAKQVAYSTSFFYNELDISTFYCKSTFTSTDFLCNFSLPKVAIGLFNADVEASTRLTHFTNVAGAIYPEPTSETFLPSTTSWMFTGQPAYGMLSALAGTVPTSKIIIYTNLLFPSMLKNIELHTDEHFINNVNRAKADIIENMLKTYRPLIGEVVREFVLRIGQLIDLLDSPTMGAAANLLAVLSFLGITLGPPVRRLLNRLKHENRDEMVRIEITPDKVIRISLKGDIVLNEQVREEVIFFASSLLKDLTTEENSTQSTS